MFAAGRMEIVRNLLIEKKKVDVLTLVKVLNVSEATVRRDLERLEDEGFLLRTHGGAVLVEQPSEPVLEDESQDEKKQIALLAATLVGSNEIIYIGSGSTCLAFARALKEKKNLTIVSSNFTIAAELAGLPNISLIQLGGSILYRESTISVVGEFAQNMLENIYADKVFLGADGVDLSFGISCANADIANVSRRSMNMSKERILLCDHTKFGRKALVKLCALTDMTMVVTDQDAGAEYKSFFFEHNIPVLVNYNL